MFLVSWSCLSPLFGMNLIPGIKIKKRRFCSNLDCILGYWKTLTINLDPPKLFCLWITERNISITVVFNRVPKSNFGLFCFYLPCWAWSAQSIRPILVLMCLLNYSLSKRTFGWPLLLQDNERFSRVTSFTKITALACKKQTNYYNLLVVDKGLFNLWFVFQSFGHRAIQQQRHFPLTYKKIEQLNSWNEKRLSQ